MNDRFTPDQIAAAKACKTVEELLTYAKDNDINLTEAEAADYFALSHPQSGELSDEETGAFSGGGSFFEEIGGFASDLHDYFNPGNCTVCNNGKKKNGVPTTMSTEYRRVGYCTIKTVTYQCKCCSRNLFRDVYKNGVKIRREYF